MKRNVTAASFALFLAAVITGCEQIPTPTQPSGPGTKTVILRLSATKEHNPTNYTDGTDLLDADTVITLPTAIGVTAGHGTGGTVALSFDGGTVDNLIGTRCYDVSNADGTSYDFSSCDNGEVPGQLPYWNVGDAVKLVAGDTLVLRVMSGDNSAPTSVEVAVAGIQKD